jgi:hypothetical protein
MFFSKKERMLYLLKLVRVVVLWKYFQRRNQETLREVGELGFLLYFIMTEVPDELVLKILGPQQ